MEPELFTGLLHFEIDEFTLRIYVNQSETNHQLFLREEVITTSHDVALYEGTSPDHRVTSSFQWSTQYTQGGSGEIQSF